MSAPSTSLLNLPPEVIELICINLIEDDPDHNPLPHLNSLMRTCKQLHARLKNSSAIWKEAARKKARLLHWESELRAQPACPRIPGSEPCANEKNFLLGYFEAKQIMRSDLLEVAHGQGQCTFKRIGPVLLSDTNMHYRVDLLSGCILEIQKTRTDPRSLIHTTASTMANMDEPEIRTASSSIFTLWRNFLLTSPSLYELRKELRNDPDKIPLLVMFDVSSKQVYQSKKVAFIDNPRPPPDLADDLVEVLQSEDDPSHGWCVVAKFIIGTFYIVVVPNCELLHTINICCFPRFKFHVEHRPYFREATSIITGPRDGSDHSFNMINLFLDDKSPGGVGWTSIRPANSTLHCYAMDIDKRGHVVALLQDSSREPFLGHWKRNLGHETSSDPDILFKFGSPFRDGAYGWSDSYQVRISHELHIAVCFIMKDGTEAEVNCVQLSPNFDTASLLFKIPRKHHGSEMMAVGSFHFALEQNILSPHAEPGRVDIFDIRSGSVLKSFQVPKCCCYYDCDEQDIALAMYTSDKQLWINWSEHPTLNLQFS